MESIVWHAEVDRGCDRETMPEAKVCQRIEESDEKQAQPSRGSSLHASGENTQASAD